MTIIIATHQCDWPGCQNTVTVTRGIHLSDLRWETRDGGLVVCPAHRFTSSQELHDAIMEELERENTAP